MADLEHRFEVLTGDRDLIGWVGDLGHEGAIFAQGRSEALPCPGWTIVENLLEQTLVFGDGVRLWWNQRLRAFVRLLRVQRLGHTGHWPASRSERLSAAIV